LRVLDAGVEIKTMAGLALDVLRTGKKYRLVNFGETHEFVIESILGNGDFKVKDTLTLERYHLKELIRFGKGKDFTIEEVGDSSAE
jgi:hypothetical protein